MVNTLQPNLQVFEMWKKTGAFWDSGCVTLFGSLRFCGSHSPFVSLPLFGSPNSPPKGSFGMFRSVLLYLQRQTLTCLSGPNRPADQTQKHPYLWSSVSVVWLRLFCTILSTMPESFPPFVFSILASEKKDKDSLKKSGVTLLPMRRTCSFIRAVVMSGLLWGILQMV